MTDSIDNLQKTQQKGEGAYIESKDAPLPMLAVQAEKKKQAPKA